AVLLGERQAEQPHLPHLAHDLVGELAPLVVAADDRGHLLAGELLDGTAQRLVFLAEHVHGHAVCGGRRHRRLPSSSLSRLASAWTTRDGLGRPSRSASQTLVATRDLRDTPVSMPRPCSIHTRSSVARLPVALLAYGQPPMPPAEASTVRTPARSAASVFASAWP